MTSLGRVLAQDDRKICVETVERSDAFPKDVLKPNEGRSLQQASSKSWFSCIQHSKLFRCNLYLYFVFSLFVYALLLFFCTLFRRGGWNVEGCVHVAIWIFGWCVFVPAYDIQMELVAADVFTTWLSVHSLCILPIVAPFLSGLFLSVGPCQLCSMAAFPFHVLTKWPRGSILFLW